MRWQGMDVPELLGGIGRAITTPVGGKWNGGSRTDGDARRDAVYRLRDAIFTRPTIAEGLAYLQGHIQVQGL